MNQPCERRWTTNLKKIEIEIHTGCNLSCPNCDRSSSQARSGEGMSLAQLEKFVSESIALRWEWDAITLLGGEPTLHPQLDRIFNILSEYRSFRPDCKFQLYSNGYGISVQDALRRIPAWVSIGNSQKSPSVNPLFSAYNLAPVDFPEHRDEDFSRGCSITRICGVGLTRYGYYPCGAGASIDRVFGLDIGIKQLEDVTPTAMVHQLKTLCSMCGHFRDFDKGFLVNIKQGVQPAEWATTSMVSPTWHAAYEAYKKAPPKLSQY
jgi:4Fe-4S single cluster domain/Radical SAM superfamily